MAQHDYNLSNNTGALYRADNNGALQAIVTQNSGTSAPTVTFPGMFWLDLSGGGDGVMRRRNQANTAWLTDIGIDQIARDQANAATAIAQAALPKAGGTMTGAIVLPGTLATNNQALSRAGADSLYQPLLPAPAAAGSLLYRSAAAWDQTLAPAANGTLLALSGGLPTWQTPTTVAAPNSIVRTGADGFLDPSLIPSVASGLRFRGTFKPAVNAEYPTTGGSGAGGAPAVGDFWVIDGLTTGGYTYLTGSLAGVTVYNGDSIAKSDTNWYRMGSSVELDGYLRIDGSTAMTGNLNMGAHNLVEVGGIVARAGTPVPLNNFSIDATNVVVSPQRGTTGADLPAMATGQIGTDLGRMTIYVGSSGVNVSLLPVRFFSSTAAYAAGVYTVNGNGGLMYRARAAVSAGAFTESQWARVMDEQGGTFTGSLFVSGSALLGLRIPNTADGYFYTDTGTVPGDLSLNYTNDNGTFGGQILKYTRGGALTIAPPVNGNSLLLTGALTLRSQGAGVMMGIRDATGTATRYYWAATDAQLSLNAMNDAGSYANSPFVITRANGNVAFGAGITAVAATVQNGLTVAIGAAINSILFNEGATTTRYYITGNATSLNFNVLSDAGAYMGTPLKIQRDNGEAKTVAGGRFFVTNFQGQDRGAIMFGGSGNVALSTDLSNNFYFNGGNVYGPQFIPTSDRAVKTNIEPVPARDLAVPFYSYNRTDLGGVFARGTIAQDVEEIAPEYVTTFTTIDGTERKGLDVAGLALECALNALDRIRALESANTTEH